MWLGAETGESQEPVDHLPSLIKRASSKLRGIPWYQTLLSINAHTSEHNHLPAHPTHVHTYAQAPTPLGTAWKAVQVKKEWGCGHFRKGTESGELHPDEKMHATLGLLNHLETLHLVFHVSTSVERLALVTAVTSQSGKHPNRRLSMWELLLLHIFLWRWTTSICSAPDSPRKEHYPLWTSSGVTKDIWGQVPGEACNPIKEHLSIL